MDDEPTLRLTRRAGETLSTGDERQAENPFDAIQFRVGDLVDGKFRLEHLLGEGGMSSVWAASDTVLGRTVALKLLGRALVSDASWRDRFSEEARNMARVRHENVVQVHSFGAHQGWPYFVMDLVDGITLSEWRRARPEPPVSDVVLLVQQVANGLDAIHAAGMIHRDIKPANVLVDRAGHVTILDLGLSSRVSSFGSLDDGSGTPSYMAPEQTVAKTIPSELARRSDIYQLGITTFELLVGSVPFEGDQITSIFARHRDESPPPPSSARPDLVEAVDTAVLTALAKDPADRYASASLFAQALAAASVRPPSILVAEDEPDQLYATCALLAAALPPGSRVEGVGDGEAALELAGREHFDALILDLHMPKLGGLDVIERLEPSDKGRPYTIVVTAMGGAEDWRALRARGAGGILLKPFDGDDLVSMVRRHIGGSGWA